MNIVNCNALKIYEIYVKENLLEVVFAVDLLIHLTSNQVCPNPPGSELEREKCKKFSLILIFFCQFNWQLAGMEWTSLD